MELKDVVTSRRSVRKFKDTPVDKALLEQVISLAAYAPSWKNTQITRYVAVTGAKKDEIAQKGTPTWPKNGAIIDGAPLLVAITMVTGRSGFERDGSFTTDRGPGWQYFDAGIATQTFSLALHDAGLSGVIMGIFDRQIVSDILELPEGIELMALMAVGYPDEEPIAPKRKEASELLTYLD